MRMPASANTGTREPFVMENGPNFEENALKTCVIENKEVHPPKRGCTSDKIYFPEEGILFSGDTLFCGSVGRSDFPTGSASTLVRSIREKLLVLPEETRVFPGHESETTIGYEKRYNPFL